MKAIYKCPHCKQATDHLDKELIIDKDKIRKSKYNIVYRVYDEINKKIIWKNLFIIKLIDILFLFSIIFLVLGFWQINGQCKEYLSDPCGYAAETNQCTVINNTYYGPNTIDNGYEFNLSFGSLPEH